MMVVAALRDASWYNTPNVRSVKQIHRMADGGVAACDRHVLLDEGCTWESDDAPADLLCQRRACFGPTAEVVR